MADQIAEKGLECYFSPPRSKYIDDDFERITLLLGQCPALQRYSNVPRLYTLLRRINCLGDLDYLLDQGFSDRSLPFLQTQLPSKFAEDWKTRFVKVQELVCDDSDVIQMISMSKHKRFSQTPTCIRSEGIIATTARGQVDIVSTILEANKSYARKQFSRRILALDDIDTMHSFENEVENMKCVVHRHCVELVSLQSYQAVNLLYYSNVFHPP